MFHARTLVRAAEEKPKPNGDRLREYRDSGLPSLEQELFSSAPVYKNLETATLALSLAQMQEALGPDDAAVKASLNSKSPEEAAKALISGTKLEDVAVRKQLYEGGKAAVDASTDPLIVLMRNVDSEARAVRKRFDDEVDAVVRRDGASIARARFDQTGFTQPPDATFTLRLSYGTVKGYEENGKKVPYFHHLRRRLPTCRGARQQASIRFGRQLVEDEVETQSPDAAELRFHGGHHRWQLGQPDREQGRRSGRNYFRRKYSVAGFELLL